MKHSTRNTVSSAAIALTITLTGNGPGLQAAAIPNRLYVSDVSASIVLIYTDGSKPALIGSITTGISAPGNMNVDHKGNLYVANFGTGAGYVTVYPPGATSPSLTISGGLHNPRSVAIARDGTVYVGDNVGEVQEYHPGATQPFLTIPARHFRSESTASVPVDLALDRAGNLFVCYFDDYGSLVGNGRFVEYAPRHVRGSRLQVETQAPAGLDVDAADDIALTTDPPFSGSELEVLAPGGRPVLDEWSDGEVATAPRLGSQEKDIYTADSSLKTVNVFSYPDGRRLRSIQLSVVPAGLAISPAHM